MEPNNPLTKLCLHGIARLPNETIQHVILPWLDSLTQRRLACVSRKFARLRCRFIEKRNKVYIKRLLSVGVDKQALSTLVSCPNFELSRLYEQYQRLGRSERQRCSAAWILCYLSGQPHAVSYAFEKLDIDKETQTGWPHLTGAHFAFLSGEPEMVDKAHMIGVDFHVRNDRGFTCAHAAFLSRNPKMVDKAVSYQLDFKQLVHRVYSCVHAAYASGNPMMIEKARALGLSLVYKATNRYDEYYTYLHAAYESGNPQMVDIAIAEGNSIRTQYHNDSHTCVKRAIESGNPEILDKAKEKGLFETMKMTCKDKREKKEWITASIQTKNLTMIDKVIEVIGLAECIDCLSHYREIGALSHELQEHIASHIADWEAQCYSSLGV